MLAVTLFVAGFPYFHERTKRSEGVEKAKYHLIGVIAHGIGSWVYTMSDKWKSDSNVTIEVLQRVLTAIEQMRGGLPGTLNVQMDNCTRENKNQWVLAYLSWLVQRGVFHTIELSFLPVGHTHEDIDQLFSRLAVYLRSHDAIDRTMLYAGIVKAFHQFGQTPICSHLESVACIRSVLEPHMLVIGNHAGRAVQHFLFKPHRNGAGMFTKSHSYQAEWDVYGGADREADDLAFHLIKPTIPSPPFKPEVRPGPSHPKPLVFPVDGPNKTEDITVRKIKMGIEVMCGDARVSPLQLSSLLRDLSDFADRKPVAFNWPHDGQFEKERRAQAMAAVPALVAADAATAAAVAALSNPYGRALRTWQGLSKEEAAREQYRTAKLEAARAMLMDSEINKLYKADLSFLSESTPAAKAAAAARGITPSAAAAAAAAGGGLKRGALHDKLDVAHHKTVLDHENQVRKLFPERLEVGHFLVLKPRIDDQPGVTAAAEAAAAAAAIVKASAAPTHRQDVALGRSRLNASRKASAAAAADDDEDEQEEDAYEEEDKDDPPAAAAGKKKKQPALAQKKKASSRKRKTTAPLPTRPFWLGKVLKFNRNDGWILFHDWTPYVSRDGVNRNVVGNAFNGNYFPDISKSGEPVVNWAQWDPNERFLWTFFTAEGMSVAGNLVENVKTRLQEIIQQAPPVRKKLVRGQGLVNGEMKKKSNKFPDEDWTEQEWPAADRASSRKR